MRNKHNKPLIMFQPFGKGITLNAIETPSGPVDSTGRSFTIESAAKLINKLSTGALCC